MHSCWDIVHRLWGHPIWPFMPTSSFGCMICDAVIALSVITRAVADLNVASPGSQSSPAEVRSDVLEDAFEHVGVVVHTQLVRDREQ